MSLRMSVLALRHDGPSYGYELKTTFEHLHGPAVGELNTGHVYQLLARLAKDGLAASRRDPQPSRPERVVYSVTAAGRSSLTQWLAEATKPAPAPRDEFHLKVVAASRVGDEHALRAVIRLQRTHVLQRLRDLAVLRATDEGGLTPAQALLVPALVRTARAAVPVGQCDHDEGEQGASASGA